MTAPSLNGQHPNEQRPNKLRFHHGSTNFSENFGTLHSITAVNLVGEGHVPHIELRFLYGARFDLMPETFAAILRDGPAAMARMPFIPEIHDAIGVGDE